MIRYISLFTLTTFVGCSPGNSDFDSRIAKLERTNERQASSSADLVRDADSLQRAVLRFSSEASRIGEDFKRAEQRYEEATRTANQSSAAFKQAAADYNEAADVYRLTATVAAIAAGQLRIDDAACSALHEKLGRSLKDANIAIDHIAADLVPAAFRALANSPTTPLNSISTKLLDAKLLDQARRAPIDAVENVSNDALAALGCSRGTG